MIITRTIEDATTNLINAIERLNSLLQPYNSNIEVRQFLIDTQDLIKEVKLFEQSKHNPYTATYLYNKLMEYCYTYDYMFNTYTDIDDWGMALDLFFRTEIFIETVDEERKRG